jgi:hypothetical protein
VFNATSQPLYPGKESLYSLYKRLGGPQGQSGWVCKISPPPGYNPQTAQPMLCHCTDHAIPAHDETWCTLNDKVRYTWKQFKLYAFSINGKYVIFVCVCVCVRVRAHVHACVHAMCEENLNSVL